MGPAILYLTFSCKTNTCRLDFFIILYNTNFLLPFLSPFPFSSHLFYFLSLFFSLPLVTSFLSLFFLLLSVIEHTLCIKHFVNHTPHAKYFVKHLRKIYKLCQMPKSEEFLKEGSNNIFPTRQMLFIFNTFKKWQSLLNICTQVFPFM